MEVHRVVQAGIAGFLDFPLGWILGCCIWKCVMKIFFKIHAESLHKASLHNANSSIFSNPSLLGE